MASFNASPFEEYLLHLMAILGFHAHDGRFQKPQDRSILHFLHYLVENCYYDSSSTNF